MDGQGTYGNYWSSTAYSSATNACNMGLDNSGAVRPAGSPRKYYGFSLRCLAATLYTHYPNYTSMTNSAGPEFVLGGYRSSTSIGGQGTYGNSWSSLASSTNNMAYTIFFNDNNKSVDPISITIRNGRSLRCLALHPHYLPTTH